MDSGLGRILQTGGRWQTLSDIANEGTQNDSSIGSDPLFRMPDPYLFRQRHLTFDSSERLKSLPNPCNATNALDSARSFLTQLLTDVSSNSFLEIAKA